jgi:WYL domain
VDQRTVRRYAARLADLGIPRHRRARALRRVPPDSRLPPAAADAHRRRGRRGGDRAAGSERDLDPYRLVPHAGRWYVTGLDSQNGAARTFRVDRVSSARLSAARFGPPADLDPRDHVARSLAAAPWAHQIEVALETTREEARRRIPPPSATRSAPCPIASAPAASGKVSVPGSRARTGPAGRPRRRARPGRCRCRWCGPRRPASERPTRWRSVPASRPVRPPSRRPR